jgi:hypothetical protein
MKYVPHFALATMASVVAGIMFGSVGSDFGQYIGGGDGRVVMGCLSSAFGAVTPWVVTGLMICRPTRERYSILFKPRDDSAKTWGWAALAAALWFDAAIVLGWVYRVVADWDVVKQHRILGNILEDDAVGGVMGVFGLVALGAAVCHYCSGRMAIWLVLLALLLVLGFGILSLSQPWPHV